MNRPSEEGPETQPEPSNDALLQRTRERLRRLLAHDPELAVSRPDAEAVAAIHASATTIETVAKAFELYADRPFVAERAYACEADGSVRLLPELRRHRYRDVWARVEAFASGLTHQKLAGPGSFIGICGFGSVDWVVADLAAIRLAAVSVPMQTNMSPADLQQIIGEAELSVIVCSVEQLDSIEAVLPLCPSVRSLVVMDLRAGDSAAEAMFERRKQAGLAESGAVVLTMREVEERGRSAGIVPMVLPSSRGEPDPLMSLIYTSGSTGTPKGAIVTERLLREQWQRGFFYRLGDALPELPQITLGYMPLNHAAGRMGVMMTVLRGGMMAFVAKSDMSTLFDDFRLARPTMAMLVPRVSATIYQHYQAELVRRTEDVTDEGERARVSDRIMEEMRGAFLGDRLLLVTTSTAPTPPEVADFLRRCFLVPVIDLYGSTEAGLVTLDDRLVPAPGLEWKLVDVPELGYRTTDRPYPRGELHVKSRFLVPGYYKNERATRDLFDDEGFLNTGDIVEQRGPNRLVWIDRARNVLKLAQGEFVATSRLEGIFSAQSPYIRQIYVHGSAFRSYLLAVVVPDLPAVTAYLRGRGVEPDDAAIKELVRSEIHRIARDEHLRGHEVPRDFIIEREPFTIARGLLTDSNKQSRPRLAARYGKDLAARYTAIERAQIQELYGLHSKGVTTATVAERVKRAMSVVLGLPEIDVRQSEQSFIQLGGDSLSAVSLETLIHDLTGVRVPVGFLLDPTSSVHSLVEYVEGALAGKVRRNVTFAEVHGAGAKSVRAEDLRIEKFLGPEEIEAARASRPASELPARAEVALLTGANGFLGRFLALELLERLSGERKKLYALVRAPSDAAAFERLASSYRMDPALSRRFDELSAEGRLTVLAGDLMKPRLGLAEDVYARLAEEVDLVLHNGALVNHALGYAAMFEPNVLGTVEVMRFALARRIKSMSFISTIAVLYGLDRTEPIREDEEVRTLFTERPTEAGYAAGYGGTKWAGELLLRDAHEKLGLPVAVFRPSEIMAHRRYHGQVNVPDFFTRLLAGIVYTGLAPRSFYTADAPDRAKHYDGTPVDVVARSIAALSIVRGGGEAARPAALATYDTYHVVNPHQDDGISLDVIVHWVKTAGYPAKRIADYDTWYRMFRERLTSLAEPKRQHSPLAILHAWEHPQGDHGQPVLDTTHILERLRSIEPSLADFPHVSEELIHKVLDDMVVLHLIDRPLRMAG